VRLVIHGGLHKTASTYFQHVLVLNREALRAANVYFAPDAHMLANHGTAWMTLLDNFQHVAAHVRQAVKAGRQAAILSSEDFETLIFDHRRTLALVQAAREAGASEVEWHFCLRDPGDCFASMYAQLSKLAFVEFVAMFTAALRDGRMRVFRDPKRYPLYWDFCFDPKTHLTAFAAAVDGPVMVHDFREATPFPAHAILDSLCPGLDFALPAQGSRNVRVSADEAEANFAERLEAALDGSGISAETRVWLGERLHIPTAILADCRRAISDRYAPGMEWLLRAGSVRE
jgi:hypothetical protein